MENEVSGEDIKQDTATMVKGKMIQMTRKLILKSLKVPSLKPLSRLYAKILRQSQMSILFLWSMQQKQRQSNNPKLKSVPFKPIHRNRPPTSFVTRYSREQQTNPQSQHVS